MQQFSPQAWQPIQQTQSNLLPTQPNHPFYYKWHPTHWQFVYRDIIVSKKKSEETVTMRKGLFSTTHQDGTYCSWCEWCSSNQW
jgi:hypothetical protein